MRISMALMLTFRIEDFVHEWTIIAGLKGPLADDHVDLMRSIWSRHALETSMDV